MLLQACSLPCWTHNACFCAAAGAEAAANAALRALAALVHAPAVRSTSSSVLEHFPLAQSLSSKVVDAADRGLDADGALPDLVRRVVGEAVAASPHCVAAVKDWVLARDGATRADHDALQVRTGTSHWLLDSGS